MLDPRCTLIIATATRGSAKTSHKLYALGWHKSETDGNGFAQWASFDNPCKRVLLVWDVATGKRTAEWELTTATGSFWRGIIPALDRERSSLLGVNVSPDGKRLFV